MATIFVHGNPETSAIWSDLVAELSQRGCDDVVLLSPPGFGAPLGDNPPRTPQEYAAWLIGELEQIEAPRHVVAHDWGAGHLFGVLELRPDLIESWVADVAGMLHPDYQWHDMAQIWQKEGEGEDLVAAMVSMDAADRAEGYIGLGMSPDIANSVAEALDEDMGASVLSLYRGATQPYMAELGKRMAAIALPPGLVVVATGDTFAGDPSSMVEVADTLGAQTVELDGAGHWWMCEQPAVAADAIMAFWND